MKKCVRFFFLALVGFTSPIFAQNPSYSSAEHVLGQASDLETWQQQLRYYEEQLSEREQTVFGKLETLQQQHQQSIQQAAEREEALRRNLQEQQEQARTQSHQTQLQQQEEKARQREAALQSRLEEQRERAAYERLQQGMQISTLQNQRQEEQPQADGQHTQATKAYGYADKQVPQNTQTQPAEPVSQLNLPASPVIQDRPTNHLLIFEAPVPIVTVAALESKIHTTVNGIDSIETRVILPDNLSVEQLDAVKKITDNGASIAQQRLGLAQYQINTGAQISRLAVIKSFVLWSLLLSVPTLLTLHWIVRGIAGGWRSWQQEKLSYKLKELESVERQLAATERQFDANH